MVTEGKRGRDFANDRQMHGGEMCGVWLNDRKNSHVFDADVGLE